MGISQHVPYADQRLSRKSRKQKRRGRTARFNIRYDTRVGNQGVYGNWNYRHRMYYDGRKTSIIFGVGKKVFSRRNVKIPAIIGDLNCFLSVEIVPVNIPLLISIKFLSIMSNQLNFSTNTWEFKNGSHVSLVKLSTGHVGIDISSTGNIRPNVLFTRKELDKTDIKLHRHFGHCGVDRLCRLITNAGGVAKRNDNQEIVNKCEICVKFGGPKPKPAVSMPLASELNGCSNGFSSIKTERILHSFYRLIFLMQ